MPTLALRGAGLHYEESGAGPPLVLLHGLGGAGSDWAPLLPLLRERFRVITPDARGGLHSHDLERPRGPFSIAQLAADLSALLAHLDALPAHLCGWSMGGMIALQLAADAPAAVRSLTIVNSGPDWTPKTPLQRLALSMRGVVTTLVGPGPMSRVLAPKLFPSPAQAGVRAGYIARMSSNDKGAYAAQLAAIVGWSVAEQLPSLSMPTLCIASDGDYTSVASKESWVKRMPDARLAVVPGARHALPLEQPETLARMLLEFLAPLEARPVLNGSPRLE